MALRQGDACAPFARIEPSPTGARGKIRGPRPLFLILATDKTVALAALKAGY
jgi:hypothetical protein